MDRPGIPLRRPAGRRGIERGENWRRIDCYPRDGFEPVQFHQIVLCLVAASSQFDP